MGFWMGLGEKNLWDALRDGGNAENMRYLVEQPKAVKEGIKRGVVQKRS